MDIVLDFEYPLVELQERLQELKKGSSPSELEKAEKKYQQLLRDTYEKLTPWQKVQIARHPNRPKTKDYIAHLFTSFTPLAGDRLFGEDQAINAGIGLFHGHGVMVMGHEKGSTVQERLKHNFGMAHPEGYRKVIRLLKMAETFGLPVVFLVDTPGAYAGIGAEERGQAQAIAQCIDVSLSLRVPIFSFIIGEGGSGGAVALATANKIFMLEHSVYSVISPEGCASILWHSADKREEAAQVQKLTSKDLLNLGIIDDIIKEPLGGAHRHNQEALQGVENVLLDLLNQWSKKPQENYNIHRREKFIAMGQKFIKK